MRTHCQTSGVSLTAQDPHNNIVRTTIEAMAAVLGGTQSLHTNSFDEALALPTPFSAKIARNTQLILAEETGIPHVVDPLGGSYYVESLTHSIAAAAMALIDEVEALGGMTKAVESGMPKLRIEESAARRQAAIDRGEEVIVGVNKYQSEDAAHVDILDVDNEAVRAAQIARLDRVRRSRDPARVHGGARGADRGGEERRGQPAGAVDRGEPGARHGRRNLRRARSGVQPAPRRDPRRSVGIYGGQYQGDEGFRRIQREIDAFAREEGRRPRMLVVKLGQDGHDRGAKVIATAFADIGFDVDIGPLFQTPEEAARQAVENDVHIVGVSSQAAGAQDPGAGLDRGAEARRAPATSSWSAAASSRRRTTISCNKAGVSAIFGPGTNIPAAAAEILSLIQKRRLAA